MSARRRLTARSWGFALIPVGGIVTPLLALPAVTSQYGAAAWASIAIGQSIGAALATFVELGWGLTGPQKAARTASTAVRQLVALSFYTKLVALAPAWLIGASIAWTLSPTYPWMAALTAVATATTGLSLAWLFLGKRMPWMVISTDSAVRFAAVALTALTIYLGGPLWSFAVTGILLPSLAAPAVGWFVVRRLWQSQPRRVRPRLVGFAIRSQWSALSARMVSSVYIALPVVLVSIAAPSSVAVFAAGERLMRLGLAALAVVPSAFHGWLGSVDRRGRWRRIVVASVANAALGAVAAIAFGVAAPLVSQLVFSGEATIEPELSWWLAGVIFVICVSRATGGLALVALRNVSAIFWSAVAGAAIGVPAILLLAARLGPVGGVIGELIAEGVVLAVQVAVILRMRARDRD